MAIQGSAYGHSAPLVIPACGRYIARMGVPYIGYIWDIGRRYLILAWFMLVTGLSIAKCQPRPRVPNGLFRNGGRGKGFFGRAVTMRRIFRKFEINAFPGAVRSMRLDNLSPYGNQ